MTKYNTAMGRGVDMSALATKNEKTRAVGNMRVNARGDLLDSHNNVIQDAQTRVTDNYGQQIVTRPQPIAEPKPVVRNQFDDNDLNN